MAYQYYIYDLEGILCYKDIELFSFCIKDRKLISYEIISDKYYPMDFYVKGITYNSFNNFFKYRVVKDGAMWIRDYLDAAGLKHYDFEELVKRNNGWNHLDYYWVKFDGLGARNWEEIKSQYYPIYK